MSDAPKLAIVICTRDRPLFLDAAMTAIEAAMRPGDEVLVVDSASTDPSVRAVAASHPAFTYVRCERPGASRARNAGARASAAPVIAFTDDDCRPQPGWADAIEAAFADNAGVGFVTGRIVPDRVGGPIVSVHGGDDPMTFGQGADPAEFGHGANVAARREAFEAVSGFDEALGAGVPLAGAEDHDLLWRILRAGWTGRYEPRAAVVHCQWRSRRQFLRAEYGYGLGSGAFGVKAIRLGAGVGILKDGLWRRGALSGAKALSRGYERAAAGDFVRLAGMVVGAARGWRLPIEAGRFTPEREG